MVIIEKFVGYEMALIIRRNKCLIQASKYAVLKYLEIVRICKKLRNVFNAHIFICTKSLIIVANSPY